VRNNTIVNATMKHSASTEVARTTHSPVSVEAVVVRRVALVDRAALHLGVALIKWGRRPLEVASRERRAHRTEQYLARLARERAAERMLRQHAPQR
jgi:hypothetical protein